MSETDEFKEVEKKYIKDTFGEFQCDGCRHYLGGPQCRAFERIPHDILDGTHDHRTPYPGDRGIRWEAKE